MKACPEREAALALLKKYNAEPFHIQHALTVEGTMRWYANELGYGEDADFWATVGLLHDVDFEQWPEEHCKKAPELLAEIGCSDEFIHAVCSHGYGCAPARAARTWRSAPSRRNSRTRSSPPVEAAVLKASDDAVPALYRGKSVLRAGKHPAARLGGTEMIHLRRTQRI